MTGNAREHRVPSYSRWRRAGSWKTIKVKVPPPWLFRGSTKVVTTALSHPCFSQDLVLGNKGQYNASQPKV